MMVLEALNLENPALAAMGWWPLLSNTNIHISFGYFYTQSL